MDEKARPERSKVLKIIGIATFVLVAGASWLAISTARYMKSILRQQFNEQQLVLARHAAQRVEAHINGAINDLLLLNSLPAIQYCDSDSYETLLLSSLPVFNGSSIIAIRRIDGQGNPIFAVSEHGIVMRSMSPAQRNPWRICHGPQIRQTGAKRWVRLFIRRKRQKTEAPSCAT